VARRTLTLKEVARRILRLKEVIRLTGLSKSSIYKRIEEGTLPRQVRLGGRAVGWWEHEIQEWLTNLDYVASDSAPGDYDDED